MNTTQAQAFYKKVDLAKLPDDLKKELVEFDKDTQGFKNMKAQDFIDFKEIKGVIENAFPQALKVPSDDDYRSKGMNPPGSKTSAIWMTDEEIAEYQKKKGKKVKRSKAKPAAKKVIKAKANKAKGTKAKAAKRKDGMPAVSTSKQSTSPKATAPKPAAPAKKKAATPKKVAAPKKATKPRVKAAPKPKAVSVRAKSRTTSDDKKREKLKTINAQIVAIKTQLKETDKVKNQIAVMAQKEYNKIVSLGKTKLDLDLEKANIQLKLYKTFLTSDKKKLQGIRVRAVGKIEPTLGKVKSTKKKGTKAKSGLRKRK